MKRIALTLILSLLLADASDVSSCGPFLPQAIFTDAIAPDHEQAFFAGQFGILRPTYSRRYLAMAYRILNGEALDASQRAAVADLERYRVSDVDGQVTQWLAARKQVKNAAAIDTLDIYRRTNFFTSITICGADAFATARKTLETRINDAGADSPEVQDWLRVQDQVFLNCAGGTYIPDPAPPGSSERVRADRTYQIAAAYFYSGNFEESRNLWREMALDTQSPWRVLAPYLIARSYLREGKYKEGETQLNAVLADKSESSLYPQARNLLDYAQGRIDPAAQLLVLSNRLMEPTPADIAHDLNDYTFLFDRFENGFASDFSPVTGSQASAAIKDRGDRFNAVAAKSDLTAWIAEYQNKMMARHDELERWRQTKSLTWLIAAARNSDQPEVLEALIKVPSSSPAYATARYYAAQTLTEQNRPDEAARLLDGILKHSAEVARFDDSTLNTFHEERMRVARTFDEFLENAPRTITSVENEGEPHKPGAAFDVDATTMFNLQLPVSLWRIAVGASALPANLRARLAQAGVVRTILLRESPNWFAEQLSTLKPSYALDLASIARLTGEEQRFEVIFWILHHPELSPEMTVGLPRETPDGRIDNYRENWWCGTRLVDTETIPGGQPPELFISPASRKKAVDEITRLQATGDAPAFLSSEVVAWANAHPADLRNAEALALAIKSSHFGCSSAGHNNAVERAFRLLHERYPSSKWAQQTPYWY